jgi:ribonuclease VapC
MRVHVFDSSALLAFLYDEPGAAVVERQLEVGGVCGAANWSEVAQKIRASGDEWALSRGLLLSYPLTIETVSEVDAEAAAEL